MRGPVAKLEPRSPGPADRSQRTVRRQTGLPACVLYPNGYNTIMKPVCFLGDSLKCLREFPREARQDAGWQLDRLQRGYQPDDFKPLPSVGSGVEELRVWDEAGTYR